MPNRNKQDAFCINSCPFKSEKFNFLSQEELEVIFSSCQPIYFDKKENVCKESILLSNAIYLTEGMVKIQNEIQKTIINIMNQENFLGIQTLFTNNKCNFTIISLTKCRVCLIPLEKFKQVLDQNTKLCLLLSKQLSNNLFGIYDLVSNIKHKSIHKKLAFIIINFSEKFYQNSNEFSLELDRKDLSDLIGSSRENTIRAIMYLNKQKVITTSGKKIKILDRIRLNKIANS